jgi:hypothetical protein
VGPRVLYMTESFTSNSFCNCAGNRKLYGLELPIVLNVKRRISERINLLASINFLAPVVSFTQRKYLEPIFILGDPVSEFIDSEGDINVFNEIRIGIGYKFKVKEKATLTD